MRVDAELWRRPVAKRRQRLAWGVSPTIMAARGPRSPDRGDTARRKSVAPIGADGALCNSQPWANAQG